MAATANLQSRSEHPLVMPSQIFRVNETLRPVIVTNQRACVALPVNQAHVHLEKIMTNENIVRAWKDPAYRNSLSEADRSALPANPAGAIEISDNDLGNVSGGIFQFTIEFCTYYCNTQICPSHPCLTIAYCRV
jgi:mersacidin/lichenicidin family type 2 lantibiotic